MSIERDRIIDQIGNYGCLIEGSRILAEHQALEKAYLIENPFWNPKKTSSISVYEAYARGPLVIQSGSLNQFPPETIAVMIDACTKRFLGKQLFGNFPWNDESERSQLIASMVQGFNSDRQIVLVLDQSQSTILGGCMVTPGNNPNIMVTELIGSPNTHLPTLWSLHTKLNGHQQMVAVPETSAVCYTRFFRVDHQTFPTQTSPDNSLVQFSKEVLSRMAIITSQWAEANGVVPTVGILDTHDPGVLGVLINHYGAVLLDDHPTPTTQVLESPMKWHYQLPGIQVVGFDFQKQVKIAQEVDAKLGEKRKI